MSLQTPVTLFIFNRPESTAQTFAAIRQARPTRLLIVAEAPRDNVPGEAARCEATRTIVEQVGWPCDVLRDTATSNMGVARRIASGIDWTFTHSEEAIFLEDDCVPDSTFFPFCDHLLHRYRNNETVSMICGSNLVGRWQDTAQSYHFSKLGAHWGFATWRRSWQQLGQQPLDFENETHAEQVRHAIGNNNYAVYFMSHLAQEHSKPVPLWDGVFTANQLLRGQKAIVSAVNLITNVGFGAGASNTHESPLSLNANAPRFAHAFPLRAPASEAVDEAFDKAYMAWRLGHPEPSLLLDHLESRLAEGQIAQVLILLRAFSSNHPSLDRESRGRIAALQRQAIAQAAEAHP